MFINHELKAIFLHNPKCGGIYITNILLYNYKFEIMNHENHPNYEEFISPRKINIDEDTDKHTIRVYGKYRFFYSYEDTNKKLLENYFIFTFVRNPYEKIFSAYQYLKRVLKNEKIRNTYENNYYFENFNIFVKNMYNVNNISFFHAFIPQYEQLMNYSNRININYIGKTETLDYDFINILTILNINKIEHCENIYLNLKANSNDSLKKKITDEINEETFIFINKYFEKDFDIFDYKKYDSYEEFINNYSKENEVSIAETNISSYTKLYKELEIINYNLNSKNNLIEKLKKITFELLDGFQSYSNNFMLNRIVKNIRNELIDNIENTENKNVEKNYTYSKKLLINNIISDLNIVECKKCRFKTFNILSEKTHNYFCK